MTVENEKATKRLIRETATRLFREKSFEAVTLADICQASGVNKHTFYYYFKSKDELLQYYYSFPWNLSAAEVTNILTSDNYVDQLWIIIKKFTDYIQKAGVAIMRQILIKNLTEDVGTFHMKSEICEIFKLMISILQKGQQAGQFRNQTDARVLIILLQQVLFSVGLTWTVFKGDFDFSVRAHFLIEHLLDVDERYRSTTEEDFRKFTEIFEKSMGMTDENAEKPSV